MLSRIGSNDAGCLAQYQLAGLQLAVSFKQTLVLDMVLCLDIESDFPSIYLTSLDLLLVCSLSSKFDLEAYTFSDFDLLLERYNYGQGHVCHPTRTVYLCS